MASNILDRIIEAKRKEVIQRSTVRPLEQLKREVSAMPKCRNFYKAITTPNSRGINVIAEVKKASPSAGIICRDFDPVRIAETYQSCGADAISVLTDEQFFKGRLEYIEQIKRSVSLAVLRKDFIIDIWQVYESRAAGADAILLIADALKAGKLTDLMIKAAELSLTVLLEVHQPDTLLKVRSLIGFPKKGYSLLGINNRDLSTMKVDINNTMRLAELVESDCTIVSESGIKSRQNVEKLRKAGVGAVLIGQSLCQGGDIAGKFKELFG